MATPNYLQTKGYTAKMDRQLIGSTIIQEGVVQPMAGELAVSAGAGLQVSVAAGSCFVQGDTNTGQGIYHVNFPSATTIAVASNATGNPRVDLICCQISDTTEAGGASDSADLVVVTGTATSGATLTNLTGAGALPASSLPLAYVLVPSGASSFTSASFADKRTSYGSSRGKSVIATSEARSNSSYGTLTTPDIVRNIVLPTDGIIAILFSGTWQESAVNSARAAIFVGTNQLKIPSLNTAPVTQAAATGAVSATATASIVTSFSGGLVASNPDALNYTGDVTTGQVVGQVNTGGNLMYQELNGAPRSAPVTANPNFYLTYGGPTYIFAAAGTYDISIQWKASTGSVTASNRRLWVWTEQFR